jgi:hypothetical protein
MRGLPRGMTPREAYLEGGRQVGEVARKAVRDMLSVLHNVDAPHGVRVTIVYLTMRHWADDEPIERITADEIVARLGVDPEDARVGREVLLSSKTEIDDERRGLRTRGGALNL